MKTVLNSMRRVLWKGIPAFLLCLHFSVGWILILQRNSWESSKESEEESQIPWGRAVLSEPYISPALLPPIPILTESRVVPCWKTAGRAGRCPVVRLEPTGKPLGLCPFAAFAICSPHGQPGLRPDSDRVSAQSLLVSCLSVWKSDTSHLTLGFIFLAWPVWIFKA